MSPFPGSVVGLDGRPGGWVASFRRGEGPVEIILLTDASELEEREWEAAAIDIPIGLPREAKRSCDVLARERLGSARSSVFTTPPRPVVWGSEGLSYGEALALSRSLTGRGISCQAFHLFPKIREVERWLAGSKRRERVWEVHPELVWQRLNGGGPLPSKKTVEGIEARVALLPLGSREAWEEARFPLRLARKDDVLDSLAALWAAEMILARDFTTLPEDPPRDEEGLPMRIAY